MRRNAAARAASWPRVDSAVVRQGAVRAGASTVRETLPTALVAATPTVNFVLHVNPWKRKKGDAVVATTFPFTSTR